jgi:ADP-heptose:LPS heptosyltransferase
MPSVPEPKNAVVFRNDKIGDLILAMPAMAALKKRHQGCRITAVVSPSTADLVASKAGVRPTGPASLAMPAAVAGQPWLDAVFAWDRGDSIGRLYRFLRDGKFDAAVFLLPKAKPALAALLARIPIRIGTGCRWFSPFFNRRVYDFRSRNLKHEAEYNIGLLAPLGVELSGQAKPVPPVIPPEAFARARVLLAQGGVSEGFVVVHPVGGGSALNCSPAHYGLIAAALEKTGFPVLVTGTGPDRPRATTVLRTAGLPEGRFLSPDTIPVLGALLKAARAVIGPATGPLHLAASLGTPTVTLIAPIRSQSPLRWHPLGDLGAVLLPVNKVCPKCDPAGCRQYNCMDSIDPDRVISAVRAVTGG